MNTKLAMEFSAWIEESHDCYPGCLNSIEQNTDNLDYVMPCLLKYNIDGELTICETANTSELFELCKAKNIPMMPLTAGNPELVASMIESPAKKKAHIAALIDYVQDRGFIGLDVDYEFLPEEMKDPYTAFIKELFDVFDRHGKLLSIDLHPKVRPDDPWSTGARAQDWKSLVNCAHILRVMCYDQYCPAYKYADPGPVSTLAWSEAVINYAASVIPLDKLIMGVPFYGMDFDTVDHTKSRWIFYREASQLREKHGVQEEWHESFGVPHFNYIDESSHPHEVWYENGRSVAGKVSIAAKYGIRGISCWAIADENPDVWPAVAQSLGSK